MWASRFLIWPLFQHALYMKFLFMRLLYSQTLKTKKE